MIFWSAAQAHRQLKRRHYRKGGQIQLPLQSKIPAAAQTIKSGGGRRRRTKLSKKQSPKKTIVVTFQMINPDAASGEFSSKEQPDPYVPLTPAGIQQVVRQLQRPNEIVIHRPWIRLLITYPLSREARFKLYADNQSSNGGFTRLELVKKIAKAYQRIYQEEQETTSTAATTIHKSTQGRISLVNRTTTNGKWGIWGHVLEDLLLTEVGYDPSTKMWRLMIDS